MAGLPVTIRLLDPPLHEFLPDYTGLMVQLERLRLTGGAAEEIAAQEVMAHKVKVIHEMNPMLGTRGCRLGVQYPEIYAMQVRAIMEAACDITAESGTVPLVEIMIPLVGFAKELELMRSLTVEAAEAVLVERACSIPYKVGTMIELPRAAITADEIAAHADFFSFGTNDLTQTTLGLLSRRRRGQVPHLLPARRGHPGEPVREARPGRRGSPRGDGDHQEPRRQAGHQAGHLRRARWRALEREVLSPHRAGLRELQPLSRAARPAGGRAGGLGGRRRRRGARLTPSRRDRRHGTATDAAELG